MLRLTIFLPMAAALTVLLLAAGSTQAQEFSLPAVNNSSFVDSTADEGSLFGISEIRIGIALSNLELLPDVLVLPDLQRSFENGRLDSITADVIFDTPDLLRWIGSPRPTIGAVINVGGYESLIHAGVDWHWQLFDSPIYAEFGLGLGVHNGYLDNAPEGYRNLGCTTLIHWQYGVGTDLGENATLTLQWQHLSNYVFGCDPNEGINNLGLAVGWKF